jgi:hypothetical protein
MYSRPSLQGQGQEREQAVWCPVKQFKQCCQYFLIDLVVAMGWTQHWPWQLCPHPAAPNYNFSLAARLT